MSVNVPVTVWRDTNGLSEYTFTGVDNIVDNLADFLIDPLGVFIVDTGVAATLIPQTEWEEDNSV